MGNVAVQQLKSTFLCVVVSHVEIQDPWVRLRPQETEKSFDESKRLLNDVKHRHNNIKWSSFQFLFVFVFLFCFF